MLNISLEKCESCLKPHNLCYCAVKPEISTQLKIVILQHPQEPKEIMSTVPLVTSVIENAVVKIGLSWANFKKIVDEPSAVPAQWAVVYLGSGIKWPDSKTKIDKSKLAVLNFVDKKGFVRSHAEQLQMKKNLKGIIFLDGTWAQAKTLWWRNPWLLKLPRVILAPTKPSDYGKLRREPKKECLSTLESVALSLEFFQELPAAEKLKSIFTDFLKKIKSPSAP